MRALGLALVLEGVLYAAFPEAMRKLIVMVLSTPTEALRLSALLSVALGLAVVVLAGAI